MKLLTIIRRMMYVPVIAVAILGGLVSSAVAAGQLNGAIYTTNSTGTAVDQNHFILKESVYLNGGPQHPGGPLLPPGTYYFQVTDPSGAVLLSTDNAVCRQVTVDATGKISGVVNYGNPSCAHLIGSSPILGASPNGTTPVQLYPFSDTPNRGGEYQVTLIAQSSAVPGCNPTANGRNLNFTNNCSKSNNFQVEFQASPACAAWHDDFSTGTLDNIRWTVGSGPAPGNSNTNISTASPANISLAGGLLTVTMSQTKDQNSVWHSTGGVIYTNVPCGYGTYEWTMRMSSTSSNPFVGGDKVSGGVSSGFIYVNRSETEINFEHSSTSHSINDIPPPDFEKIWFVNFWNRDPGNREALDSEGTGTFHVLPDLYSTFHHYKFIWEPGVITFYIDNLKVAVHDSHVNVNAANYDPNVPSAPAYFYISHFGRDFLFWGGPATEGTRYFLVKYAAYTPLK